MATIRKRKAKDGRISYSVVIRLAGKPTFGATFSNPTDARRWVAIQEGRVREHRHFPDAIAKRKTVADVVDRWCSEVAPERKDGAKTARQLQWWKRQIGHVRLATLTPATIAATRDELVGKPTRRGIRSPATVNRYFAALSSALGMASKEWGWLRVNPAKGMAKKREAQGRVRFLSSEERAALLKAAAASSDWRLRPLVLLSITTGARQAELLNLEWRHVDLERGTALATDTKNREHRMLHLVGEALEEVRRIAKVRRRVDSPLVFASEAGKPRFPRRQWEQARDAAGLEDFRWHDLRHSAASYLAMSGSTLTEIAAVLGHKTLAMVKRYSHLSEGHVRSAVERAAEKFADV